MLCFETRCQEVARQQEWDDVSVCWSTTRNQAAVPEAVQAYASPLQERYVGSVWTMERTMQSESQAIEGGEPGNAVFQQSCVCCPGLSC